VVLADPENGRLGYALLSSVVAVELRLPAGSHPAAAGNTPPPSTAITDTGTGGT
jgi:hypothetical protein